MLIDRADIVKETSVTTGTGAYSLAGAPSGYQTFVAGIGNGKKCRYHAFDGTNSERGIGTITDGTPDTLSRDFITGSSNGGAAVNWGAGTKTIVCTHTADEIDSIFAAMAEGDPNGFIAATTAWSFSYNAGTRTLTLTPTGASADFWSNGLHFRKTTAQAVTHADTEGMHYFYFDDAGVLQTTMTFSTDMILKYCIAAIGYWDATNNVMVPDIQWEMHGSILSAQEHLIKHVTVGSVYDKLTGGLTPTVTLGDGSSDTHIQVSSTSGAFYDEDIKHTVASEAAGTNKVKLYRSGANGDWRMSSADSAIIRTGGSGRAVFNEFTGGAWQDTELTDGYFMHVHRYVVNAPTPFSIYVQGQAQYSTVEAAQAAAQTRPNLGALPGYEFLLVQTLIVQSATAYTNTYNSRIVATHTGAGWYDWREHTPQAGSGATGSGSGTALSVNGTSLSTADLDDAAPAAPGGGYPVKWQQSGGNVSGYVDVADEIAALRRKPYYYTDFVGAVGAATLEATLPWDVALISSGTQAIIESEPNHWGIWRCSSSTTANSGAYVRTDVTTTRIEGGEFAEFVFQHRVASGTNTTIRGGFIDTGTSSDCVDGAYFEVPTNSLALVGKTSNNSVRSTTGTSYTLTVNTWYRLTIQVNTDATLVTYTLYDASGTQLWQDTLSTNIPTGAGRSTGHGFIATNAGTTATLLAYLDWMAVGKTGKALTR